MNRRYILWIFLISSLFGFVAYRIFHSDDNLKSYYPNGDLKQIIPIKDGKPDGIVKEYFENGVLKSEVDFVNGQQTGDAKFYYETGELKKRCSFHEGIENDSSFIFHKNGVLLQKSFLVNGREEGKIFKYHDSGIVELEGQKQNGTRVGNWNFYDSSGVWTRTIFYVNDTIQSLLSGSHYINFLAGAEIMIPNGMNKVLEMKNTASFAMQIDNLGTIALSIGSGAFVKSTLKEQVEYENSIAKETFPYFEIKSLRSLSNNMIKTEYKGTQVERLNGVEFQGYNIYSNNNGKFVIVSLYVPWVKKDERAASIFLKCLDSFRLRPMEVIVE